MPSRHERQQHGRSVAGTKHPLTDGDVQALVGEVLGGSYEESALHRGSYEDTVHLAPGIMVKTPAGATHDVWLRAMATTLQQLQEPA